MINLEYDSICNHADIKADLEETYTAEELAYLNAVKEIGHLARIALIAANPNGTPWRCEAFKNLDEALRRVGL